MKNNPTNKGSLGDKLTASAPVTREMLHARTRELALIANRASPEVSQADYEQAKQELTGESDINRQDAIIDALSKTNTWDPVPGSGVRQAPETANEDEDDEGRSETEQLVDVGSEKAERERMLQAARNIQNNK